MSNEIVYELPDSWTWTTIGEISILRSGGTPDRKNLSFYRGTIPWVKSGELNYNTITQTEEQINNLAIENSGAKIFPKETILVALYGSTVGKLAILGIEATTNQAIAGIITTKSFENKYLYYYLLKNREKFLQQRQGGAQANISLKIITDFPIPFPPLNEQYRIVEKIEELFSELNEAEQSLKEAKKMIEVYKHILLTQAFNGQLTRAWRNENQTSLKSKRAKKIFNSEINDRLPIQWKWAKVKDVAIVIMGQSPPGSSYNNKGVGTPLINGPVEFGPSPFSLTLLSKWTTEPTRFCLPEDLILCVRGSTTGRQNIAGFKACIGRGVAAIRAISAKQKYLYHYFNYSRRKILEMGTGTTFPNISHDQLINFLIPLCSPEEQLKVVNEIEYRVTIIENLEQTINENIKKIEYYRQIILKKAFNGKLVAPNRDDESAQKLLDKIKKEKEEYLIQQATISKLTPKKRIVMKEKLSILEILKEAQEPISAQEVWQQSIYNTDIDEFYAAIKTHLEKNEIIEAPRKGTESFLTLTISK